MHITLFKNYFRVPKMFIMPIKYLKILALIINEFSLIQMLVGEHVYSLLTNARPIVDCIYLLNCIRFMKLNPQKKFWNNG